MEIIVFSNRDNSQRDLLLREISKVSDLRYRMTFDFDTLFDGVKGMPPDGVVVILITFEEEIDFFISNRKRLFYSRCILILPDEEEILISKGCSLYPRYIAQTDDGFRDVAAVLNKMVDNAKN
ncbi:MAG: hypothetical protein R6U68_05265 [Desulfobacteraceae bacterium]